MYSRLTHAFLWGALIAGIAGCDSAPGPEDLETRPPVVSNLSVSPLTVLIDHLPPGSVIDGIAHFSVEAELDATDKNGDLDVIYFTVQSPIPEVGTVARLDIPARGNRHYETDIDFEIPTGAIGTYVVEVTASDASGRLGNVAIGSFEVSASGTPPVIESVQIPERIVRPAPGQPAILIPIVARVTDPDGRLNILRVEVVVNGSTTLQLCDDGSTTACNGPDFSPTGDATAGDGQYTLTIELTASNSAGENTFVFKAIDRSGLESATISRTIVVE